MKIEIRRNDASQELVNLINTLCVGQRYAETHVYLCDNPIFFNRTGKFIQAHFTPEHTDSDGYNWKAALWIEIEEEPIENNPYGRTGINCYHAMWAADSREPGDRHIMYFENGHEIHWIFDGK